MGKRLIAFALLAVVILGTAACTKKDKTVMESSAVGKRWTEFTDSKAAGYNFTNKVIGDNYSSQGVVLLQNDALNVSIVRELQKMEKHLIENVTADIDISRKFHNFWMSTSVYVLSFYCDGKAVYIGFIDDLCAFSFAQEGGDKTAYFRVDCDTDEFTERLDQLVEDNNKTNSNG